MAPPVRRDWTIWKIVQLYIACSMSAFFVCALLAAVPVASAMTPNFEWIVIETPGIPAVFILTTALPLGTYVFRKLMFNNAGEGSPEQTEPRPEESHNVLSITIAALRALLDEKPDWENTFDSLGRLNFHISERKTLEVGSLNGIVNALRAHISNHKVWEDKAEDAARDLDDWTQFAQKLQPGGDLLSVTDAHQLLDRVLAKADYTPFFASLQIPAAQQAQVQNSQDLWNLANQWVVDNFTAVFQQIPEKYRKGKETPTATSDIQEAVQRLKNGVNRLTQTLETPTEPSVPLSAFSTFLSNMTDVTPENLLDRIQEECTRREKAALASEPRIIGTGKVPCDHPIQLALALGPPTTLNALWEDSLARVRKLASHICPTVRPKSDIDMPEAPPTEYINFRATDVPEFDSTDYWTWRRNFDFFAHSVNPANIATAVALVTSRFSGEARKTLMAYDISDLTKATWDATYKTFLQYCDQHFLPPDAYQEQLKVWRNLRHSATLWGTAYINRFWRESRTLNQIARLEKQRVLSNGEILMDLVRRLPAVLRVRFETENPHYTLGVDEDDKLATDHLRTLESMWNVYHTEQLAASKGQPKDKTSAKISATPASQDPNIKKRGCGRVSSYDFPRRIPEELRGPIYFRNGKYDAEIAARNARCRKAGVCENCRDNAREHGEGTTFHPVRPATTKTAPALPAPDDDGKSVVSVD